jgi:hypothetical protein
MNKKEIMQELNQKANVSDVDSGFKKMSNYLSKNKIGSLQIRNEDQGSLLSNKQFESTEALTQMGKYEIIKSLKEELREGIRNTEAKFDSFLGKMEFYSFCDKFSDFTNSYEKMKIEVGQRIDEIYEKITSEVIRSHC